MSAISTTSIADSTDSRVSDLVDAGYSRSATKVAAESRALSCMSSARHFGSAGAQIHALNPSGDCAVYKDCNIIDAPLAAKPFYDRNSEYLKNDHVQWEEFVKVQRTSAAMSDSLPGVSLGQSSTSGVPCKFIKNEKEPSVIMDASCSRFEPSPEISALDNCCDADSKQPHALGEGEPSGFSAPRPGLEAHGSPNFLIDLNSSEPLASQVRVDSRCALPTKAGIGFDGGAHSPAAQHAVARWHLQTSPGEPQFWPAGVPEDAFPASSYDGIQNQNPAQRNPSPFSGFPG